MSDNCLPIRSSNSTGEGACCGNTKELTVSETDLFFQLTLLGERTPPQKVIVSNTGKASVKIKAVRIVRGNFDFTLVNSNNYPSVLNPGEAFNVVVDFTARVDGHILGMLEISTNEDKLPYVLGLSSRVRTPEGGEGGAGQEALRLLQDKLLQEIRDRTSGDTDLGEQISTEKTQRTNADSAESAVRQSEDSVLRLLAQTLTTNEAAIRLQNDEALDRRLKLVERNQSEGTVFGVDGEARASIATEITVRANADLAEVVARQTLDAKFTTQISAANAKIVEESQAYADRYQAIGARTATIEAKYQSADQVRAIANALVKIEETARATADSAEATVRQTQVAELTTALNFGLETERTTRLAAIRDETNARVNADSAEATRVNQLLATYTTIGALNASVSAEVTNRNTAISNAVLAEANRVNSLLANYASSAAIDQKVNAAITEEARVRANAIGAEATRVNQLLAGYSTTGSVDQKVSAAVSEEARLRVLADQASATNVAILSASISKSGGNFLGNTNFLSTEGWGKSFSNGNETDISMIINWGGDLYHPLGENVLSIYQGPARNDNSYCEWYCQRFPVSRGITPYIQPYVFFNSHFCDADMFVVFYDDINQRNVGATPSVRRRGKGGSGQLLENYVQLGFPYVSVPDGTTSAYLLMRKHDTIPGSQASVAWFWRPYVGEAFQGQTTWNPYVAGTGAPSEGSIIRQQAVLVNNQGAQARSIEEVRAIAGGASSTASVALSAAQGAQGTLGQARVRLLADAGNGRAQMDLFSDQYGISGVDIIGQTRFLGNNGGNQIIIDNNKGIDMIAPNGVHFVELGLFG